MASAPQKKKKDDTTAGAAKKLKDILKRFKAKHEDEENYDSGFSLGFGTACRCEILHNFHYHRYRHRCDHTFLVNFGQRCT